MFVLCSPPSMRISQGAADEIPNRQLRTVSESPGVPPRLWLRLPVEARRQLAQQIGHLVQQLRLQSVRPEENDRVDHDVVGR